MLYLRRQAVSDLLLPVSLPTGGSESLFLFTPDGKRIASVPVDRTSDGRSRLRNLKFEGPFAGFIVF